ncbi:uncharacterized protein LOC120352065 [Nilaparvata lugens]|uniref:uncharacterized protein LOC120352065 n=1 Tax=Nilaparvata lugens TaxID=108931 RepID=UPI00193DDF74|nr:uncharacterized protein LOC120352065 [Nilaparvata lugens]
MMGTDGHDCCAAAEYYNNELPAFVCAFPWEAPVVRSRWKKMVSSSIQDFSTCYCQFRQCQELNNTLKLYRSLQPLASLTNPLHLSRSTACLFQFRTLSVLKSCSTLSVHLFLGLPFLLLLYFLSLHIHFAILSSPILNNQSL